MSNDFPKLRINTEDLKYSIEALLIEARGMERAQFGAVNWGDLGVVDIEYRLSMLYPDSGPYCVVTIEEASRDCDLARWLSTRLDKQKFPNTHIECDW